MAKPAKIKKEKDTASAGQGKAAKAAKPSNGDKTKVKAKKQPAAGGLKGRLSKAQASAKPARGAKGKAAPSQGNRTAKFLRAVRLELSKVTWPTREELIQSTIMVVIAVSIAGAYIFVFDTIFAKLIGLLSGTS